MSVSPPFWDFEQDEDPIILEIVSEERQKLPAEMFLDFGPSLPARYGVDQLELMVQSPLRVFAYWELTETTLRAALNTVPIQDRPNFQLLLKWKEKDIARERCFDPGATANWWFDTLPESRYQVELGLGWEGYGWLPVLASGEVLTPRLTLGPPSQNEPVQTEAFLRELVRETGIGLRQDERPRASESPAAEAQPVTVEASSAGWDEPATRPRETGSEDVSQRLVPLWLRPTSR
ncbi:MAG: DUF4912 domain-containing protein [Acidobacteria bacterium]|nr:DUF4912 domain-containing protein [Acidobacteriota bacterium]